MKTSLLSKLRSLGKLRKQVNHGGCGTVYCFEVIRGKHRVAHIQVFVFKNHGR